MADFVITDDVLAPKSKEVMEFKVVDPFSFYSKMSATLQTIFKGRGKDVFEDDFKWDITADPIDFYVRTRFMRTIDKFTEGTVMVRMYGKQPKDMSKVGSVMFEIGSFIETKYPTSTPFQKFILLPFLYMYHFLIYNKVRRQYIEFWRDGVERLTFDIRENYGVALREALRR